MRHGVACMAACPVSRFLATFNIRWGRRRLGLLEARGGALAAQMASATTVRLAETGVVEAPRGSAKRTRSEGECIDQERVIWLGCGLASG
jgi:hypothetical protein